MSWLKRIGWMAMGALLMLTAQIVLLLNWLPSTHMWG